MSKTSTYASKLVLFQMTLQCSKESRETLDEVDRETLRDRAVVTDLSLITGEDQGQTKTSYETVDSEEPYHLSAWSPSWIVGFGDTLAESVARCCVAISVNEHFVRFYTILIALQIEDSSVNSGAYSQDHVVEAYVFRPIIW